MFKFHPSQPSSDNITVADLRSEYLTYYDGWTLSKAFRLYDTIVKEFHATNPTYLRWEDHPVSLKHDDGRYGVLFQPYFGMLHTDHLRYLIEVAERLNLDLSVGLNAPWYPGKTIAVLFVER